MGAPREAQSGAASYIFTTLFLNLNFNITVSRNRPSEKSKSVPGKRETKGHISTPMGGLFQVWTFATASAIRNHIISDPISCQNRGGTSFFEFWLGRKFGSLNLVLEPSWIEFFMAILHLNLIPLRGGKRELLLHFPTRFFLSTLLQTNHTGRVSS